MEKLWIGYILRAERLPLTYSNGFRTRYEEINVMGQIENIKGICIIGIRRSLKKYQLIRKT